VLKVFDARLPEHLVGVPFADLVEWLYRTSNFVLIGKPVQRLQALRQNLLHPDPIPMTPCPCSSRTANCGVCALRLLQLRWIPPPMQLQPSDLKTHLQV
jgi:hypothetical protein